MMEKHRWAVVQTTDFVGEIKNWKPNSMKAPGGPQMSNEKPEKGVPLVVTYNTMLTIYLGECDGGNGWALSNHSAQ